MEFFAVIITRIPRDPEVAQLSKLQYYTGRHHAPWSSSKEQAQLFTREAGAIALARFEAPFQQYAGVTTSAVFSFNTVSLYSGEANGH